MNLYITINELNFYFNKQIQWIGTSSGNLLQTDVVASKEIKKLFL